MAVLHRECSQWASNYVSFCQGSHDLQLCVCVALATKQLLVHQGSTQTAGSTSR